MILLLPFTIFVTVYFAVRLAIRHELTTGSIDPGVYSTKSFWFVILAVITSVAMWNFFATSTVVR